MESNDSPEIPDREETSDIPGLPSGVFWETFRKRYIVERTNRAEVRSVEESEKAENCWEDLWNKI